MQLFDAIDATASAAPTSAFAGFSHPHFRRGDERSLKLIKPKPNKGKGPRKATGSEDGDGQSPPPKADGSSTRKGAHR